MKKSNALTHVLMAGAVVIGGLGVVGATPAVSQATDCHWKVTWPVAGVYEKPTRSSTDVKDKYAGDIVGPYCTTYYNSTECEYYVMVACASAADGIGWMRKNALVQV